MLLLVIGSAFGLRSFLVHNSPKPFAQYSITQATNSGTATLVALSPDGKYLLFTKREDGLESLWLRNIPTSSDTQVVQPSPNPFASLSFSPDGNYLYFRQAGDKTGLYDLLFRAPVLGGTPKLLVRDIDAHPVFSPDGQKMMFIRCNNPEPNKCRWISSNIDGANEQSLFIRNASIPSGMSWSVDGKYISFAVLFASAQENNQVAFFDVAKNQEVPFYSAPDKRFTDSRWMPDGRGVLVCIARQVRTMRAVRSDTSRIRPASSNRLPMTRMTTLRSPCPAMAAPSAPSRRRTCPNWICCPHRETELHRKFREFPNCCSKPEMATGSAILKSCWYFLLNSCASVSTVRGNPKYSATLTLRSVVRQFAQRAVPSS